MAKNRKKNRITSGGLFNQPAGGNTIILTQAKRWHMDIENYIRSVTEAERIDFPNRSKLQDLYTVAMTDTHLFSVMEKRKSAVLSTPIEFSRNGKPDKRIAELIESPWFRNFLSDILDSIWLGPTLFQFYIDSSGWLTYDLIPRKHVDPINREIRKLQSDIKGVSWDEYADLLFIGNPRETGNMVKAVPWILYKNGTAADWAQFAEIFGQPMREGTYDAWDDNARQKLINDIMALGSSPVFIHPEGTKINLIESSQKGSTCDVYERLATFCNSEISKRVLGNTLTTEVGDKGTQALGTVQQEGEQDITFFVKRRLLNILNYDVTETFANLGINTTGGKFSFVPPKKKDLSAKITIDCKLKNEIGLPIDDDYFYEEYGT